MSADALQGENGSARGAKAKAACETGPRPAQPKPARGFKVKPGLVLEHDGLVRLKCMTGVAWSDLTHPLYGRNLRFTQRADHCERDRDKRYAEQCTQVEPGHAERFGRRVENACQ